MTESDRPGDRPWPAPTGDADWWRGDGDDFPVSPAAPLPSSGDLTGAVGIEAAGIEAAGIEVVRPRPAVIVDAELVDTDPDTEDPDRPPVSADVTDPADVVDGELLEAELEATELDPEFDRAAVDQFEDAGRWVGSLGVRWPGPRPFDGAPRTLARPATLPPPPARPAAPAPMLGPVPVPVIFPAPREAGEPGPAVAPDPTVHPGLPAGGLADAVLPGQRRPAPPRRPWVGLPSLVVLALVAAFFGWVSAEPFWLAVGHAQLGTATVVADEDHCRATFVADGGAFTASTVDLSGVDRSACAAGATIRARMVGADSDRAYAVDRTGLVIRIGLGYGLVLLCGLLIGWATGAARFRGWRRVLSVGLSLAAPLAVAAALLAAAY